MRIVMMVIRNLFRIPYYWFMLNYYGRAEDKHTEEQRYYFLRRFVRRVNLTGRVKIITTGSECLEGKKGYILFPNHQGLFDVLALIESCPNPFGVVIKKEAVNIILIKQVVRFLRGISMDREDIRSSMQVINQMTEEVKQGRNYVIFPEGTRSKLGNTLLEFKAGTFKSAVNAKCPIVPVALIDSYKPFDQQSIKSTSVQVHYLKPIEYEEYKGMKTKEIAAMVQERIQSTINEKIGR